MRVNTNMKNPTKLINNNELNVYTGFGVRAAHQSLE